MSTASNVVWIDNSTPCDTITISDGTTGDWWYPTNTTAGRWYPYSYAAPDKVRELSAWLDGYLDGHKLSEKSLKRIRAKLDEFLDE